MSIRQGNNVIGGVQSLKNYYNKSEIDTKETTINETINTTNNTCVHKSGNEEIDGVKIFTSSLYRKDNRFDYTEIPSSDIITPIYFRDKNNEIYGACETVKYKSGDTQIRLNIRGVDGNWSDVPLSLGRRSDGSCYVAAPTTYTTANSSEIATTNWVRSFTPYLKTCYVNGTSGYNIWSNGYCEQWGRTTGTVTFSKTFANADICIVGGLIPGTESTTYEHLNIKNISATGFTFGRYDNYTLMWKACGYLAAGQY